jgi:hypothetical protein
MTNLINLEEADLVVTIGNGQRFRKSVDELLAVRWLESINNNARIGSGNPIWKASLKANFTLWQIVQHSIFRELKELSRYRELIKFLVENSYLVTPDSHITPRLRTLLRDINLMSKRKKNLRFFVVNQAHAYHFLYRLIALIPNRSRSSIAVYTPERLNKDTGEDPRMAPLYGALKAIGQPWIQVFHSNVTVRQSFTQRLKHRILPLSIQAYLPFFAFQSKKIDVSSIPEGDSVIRFWCQQRLSYFVAITNACGKAVDLMSKDLIRLGVKIMIGMDDFRLAIVAYLACRQAKIPTILIQHGTITPLSIGWSCPGIPTDYLYSPDRYLIHGPFWRKAVAQFAPQLQNSAIVVRGWHSADSPMIDQNNIEFSKTPIIVLLFETSWPDRGAYAEFVQKLCSQKNAKLYFKVRKDLNIQQQTSAYFTDKQIEDVCICEDLNEIEGQISACIGNHSTYLYELASKGIPIIKMDTNFKIGDLLVQEKLCHVWYRSESFTDTWNRFLTSGDENALRARDMLRSGDDAPDFRELIRTIVERLS